MDYSQLCEKLGTFSNHIMSEIGSENTIGLFYSSYLKMQK